MVASRPSRAFVGPASEPVKWLADENFNNAIIRGLLRHASALDLIRAQEVRGSVRRGEFRMRRAPRRALDGVSAGSARGGIASFASAGRRPETASDPELPQMVIEVFIQPTAPGLRRQRTEERMRMARAPGFAALVELPNLYFEPLPLVREILLVGHH